MGAFCHPRVGNIFDVTNPRLTTIVPLRGTARSTRLMLLMVTLHCPLLSSFVADGDIALLAPLALCG
ncbi:MAG: hypothetical protein ACI4AN_08170 [Muribaculaceae bacterium]